MDYILKQMPTCPSTPAICEDVAVAPCVRDSAMASRTALPADLHEMGLRVRIDAIGLISRVLPAQAQQDLYGWTVRQRHGLVPDFLIAAP